MPNKPEPPLNSKLRIEREIMSSDTYEVTSFDQEDNGKWYATVLHICNQKPIAVYRVPSDPPMYSGMEEPTHE